MMGKPNMAWMGKRHSEKTRAGYRWVRNTPEWNAKTHTPERNLRASIAVMGQKNCNWKHGRSSIVREQKKAVRKLSLYKRWRSAVFERDGFTCQLCGQVGGKLEAHHIKSYIAIVREKNLRTIDEIRHCVTLWDIANGQTLCVGCHNGTKRQLEKVHQ